MKARIPTNVSWTAESLIKALGRLDPGTELVFGSPPKAAGAKTCWCGCGNPTKNKFAVGHDARFHGEAKRAARGEIAIRTNFVNDEARADWMKWFSQEQAEIAAKTIPVEEVAMIEEVTEIEVEDTEFAESLDE